MSYENAIGHGVYISYLYGFLQGIERKKWYGKSGA